MVLEEQKIKVGWSKLKLAKLGAGSIVYLGVLGGRREFFASFF
jgi:hypothetical protein